MTRAVISRRMFLRSTGLAVPALYGSRPWAQTPDVVRTKQGSLAGFRAGGVRTFHGMRYAQAPVGDRRFRAPEPLPGWSGVRDASKFGPAATQPDLSGVPQSEDCLFLNLWAPAGNGPFPVFVWVHGGGFTGGYAFEPVYDGTEFARQGIISISVGYRLGAFGFLDLEPALGASYAGSANNALLDLVAALQWIKENVADFGGDPSRVTIGGESAGAKLTDILMGVPAARTLFHQAVSESGGAERVWGKADALKVGGGFDKAWHEAQGRDAPTLLRADASRLMAVQKKFMDAWPQHFPLRPEIDGKLVAALPLEVIRSGSTRGKRLLIGTNRDESALFIGPDPTHNATARDVGNISLQAFNDVYERYKVIYPTMTDVERRIRSLTAEEYWIPTIRVADAHVERGLGAWMYQLAFAETSGRLSGYAYHSLDVGLVWNKPHSNVTNRQEEATLARQMHTAWSAFIRGESPAAPGLPDWMPYTSATRPTMMLDTQSRIELHTQEAELRLWDGVL